MYSSFVPRKLSKLPYRTSMYTILNTTTKTFFVNLLEGYQIQSGVRNMVYISQIRGCHEIDTAHAKYHARAIIPHPYIAIITTRCIRFVRSILS
mgnify:FL=1